MMQKQPEPLPGAKWVPEPPKVQDDQPLFSYDIPKEKVADVGAYLQRLQTKFPHIKRERLMRKAAEHFKLKKL